MAPRKSSPTVDLMTAKVTAKKGTIDKSVEKASAAESKVISDPQATFQVCLIRSIKARIFPSVENRFLCVQSVRHHKRDHVRKKDTNFDLPQDLKISVFLASIKADSNHNPSTKLFAHGLRSGPHRPCKAGSLGAHGHGRFVVLGCARRKPGHQSLVINFRQSLQVSSTVRRRARVENWQGSNSLFSANWEPELFLNFFFANDSVPSQTWAEAIRL